MMLTDQLFTEKEIEQITGTYEFLFPPTFDFLLTTRNTVFTLSIYARQEKYNNVLNNFTLNNFMFVEFLLPFKQYQELLQEEKTIIPIIVRLREKFNNFSLLPAKFLAEFLFENENLISQEFNKIKQNKQTDSDHQILPCIKYYRHNRFFVHRTVNTGIYSYYIFYNPFNGYTCLLFQKEN